MLRGLADGSLLDQIRVQCVRLLSCGVNQQIENSIDALSRECVFTGHEIGVDVDFTHVIHNDSNLEVVLVVKDVVQQRGLARPKETGKHCNWKFRVSIHAQCIQGFRICRTSCCKNAGQSAQRLRRISPREGTRPMQKLPAAPTRSTSPMLPTNCAKPKFLNSFSLIDIRPVRRRSKRRNRRHATKSGHRCSMSLNKLVPQTKMA